MLLALVVLAVSAVVVAVFAITHSQPAPTIEPLSEWVTVTQAMELLREPRAEVLLRISFHELTTDPRSATVRIHRASVERVQANKRRTQRV